MQTEILGWTLTETKDGETILHYLYCKDPYLDRGIPEFLIRDLIPGIITHNQGWKCLRKWKLIPEIARRKNL